jgi:hypothetical protein
MKTIRLVLVSFAAISLLVGCSTNKNSVSSNEKIRDYAVIQGTSSRGQDAYPTRVDGVELEYGGYKLRTAFTFPLAPGSRTIVIEATFTPTERIDLKNTPSGIVVVNASDRRQEVFKLNVSPRTHYLVRSRLEGNYAFLWIEDSGSGRAVTDEHRIYEDLHSLVYPNSK